MRRSRSARWAAFIESLKVRTNDDATGRPVTKALLLRHGQRTVWETVAERIDRLEPIRLIIMKSRRIGISTQINSWLTTFIASVDQVQALITAHQVKPAKQIWGMSKFFVNTSPILKRVATIGNNTITVGRSTLTVATAGTPESERGTDLTAWLADEAAYYTKRGVWVATMQCLPQSDKVFSIGVIASTANGKTGDGEEFYNFWRASEEGENEWLPIFLPWWKEPEYCFPHLAIEEATDEEKLLRQQFELNDGQLAWRRWAIRNKCKNDEEFFLQEYPSTADSAFVTAGNPFFMPSQLQHFEAEIYRGKRFRVDVHGSLTPDPNGHLELWQMPEEGHTYVCGADSSMGIEDAKGEARHSRSGAEILDMDTLEQVGEYDAASAPHLFAAHLAGIGRLYNNALIAPEVQSSGGGGGREIIVYLREKFEYWNIHRWQGHPDKIQRVPSVLLGWECVAPWSKVLTEDWRWVRADSVAVGDALMGVDVSGVNLKPQPQRVTACTQFDAPVIEVTLWDGRTTRVSATHPFWASPDMSERQPWSWVLAEDLRPNQRVKVTGAGGLESIVVADVKHIGNGPVIGLTTDPDHTLIADGIVGHNTNARTRPRMLARLREVIMERSVIIHSRRLLNQISDFGEDDHGHTEALSGRDDLLFAYGIALMSRSENWYKMPAAPSTPPSVDWSGMGIRVLRQETPEERFRRIMMMDPEAHTPKSFMEF